MIIVRRNHRKSFFQSTLTFIFRLDIQLVYWRMPKQFGLMKDYTH